MTGALALRAALVAEIARHRRHWIGGAPWPHDLAIVARDVARRKGHGLAEALAEIAHVATDLRLPVLRPGAPLTKARIAL